MTKTPAPKKRQSTIDLAPKPTNGFTPGGYIPDGYSYLQRAHSLKTTTRTTKPMGMESPSKEQPPSPLSSQSSVGRANATDFLAATPSKNVDRQSSRDKKDCSLPGNTVESAREGTHKPNVTDVPVEANVDGVSGLPGDPRTWTAAQVAVYLTHVLGVTPKPVIEDVTAFVRRSHMGGQRFLRLRERELADKGVNLKWRKLMIEAVKKLRRDCLRGGLLGSASELAARPSILVEGDEDLSIDKKEQDKASKYNAFSLQRLRDRGAVRGGITTFESVRDIAPALATNTPSPGRLQKSDYFEQHREITKPRSSLQQLVERGYVKDRAADFASGKITFAKQEYTREHLREWFGDLTDQEWEDLADEVIKEDGSKIGSQIAGKTESPESIPLSPIADDVLSPIIKLSDVEEPEKDGVTPSKDTALQAKDSKQNCSSLASIEDAASANSSAEEGTRKDAQTNKSRYRASTYDDEDLAALGLDANQIQDSKCSTLRRKSAVKSENGGEEATAHSTPGADLTNKPSRNAAEADASAQASSQGSKPSLDRLFISGSAFNKDAGAKSDPSDTVCVPVLSIAQNVSGSQVCSKQLVKLDRSQLEAMTVKLKKGSQADSSVRSTPAIESDEELDKALADLSATLEASTLSPSSVKSPRAPGHWSDGSGSDAEYIDFQANTGEGAQNGKRWNILDIFQITPRYAIGFAAGLGFVVLTDLIGGRRQ